MHHDQNTPVSGPDDNPKGHYPETAWSRFRQTGMPTVIAFGVAMITLGLVMDYRWLAGTGLMACGLGFITGSAAVVLEYRADMRYDREHPETEVAS
jgi:hypothetical protein